MVKLKPILGVAMGDACGVGPEIVAKVAASGFLSEHCRPVIVGDVEVLRRGCKAIGKHLPLQVIAEIDEADWESGLPVLDVHKVPLDDLPYGTPLKISGEQCMQVLQTCADLCGAGKMEGFVFAPIHKAAMKMAGNRFESEHHYLAHLFGAEPPFGEISASAGIMTTRTTSHIPLSAVSAALSVEKILGVTHMLNDALLASGIHNPRVGVAACNPHGGDNGACGREEIDIIMPAVAQARAEGIDAEGPIPSDIIFMRAFQGELDGVVTMYHDQGQIATKLKGFNGGITISGGLPYPVVTCAQGTAYDIAGRGVATTDSLENAVKMCAGMAVKAYADQ